MGPLADDFPPVHHNNLVGIADRVQVVGDRDDGLVTFLYSGKDSASGSP